MDRRIALGALVSLFGFAAWAEEPKSHDPKPLPESKRVTAKKIDVRRMYTLKNLDGKPSRLRFEPLMEDASAKYLIVICTASYVPDNSKVLALHDWINKGEAKIAAKSLLVTVDQRENLPRFASQTSALTRPVLGDGDLRTLRAMFGDSIRIPSVYILDREANLLAHFALGPEKDRTAAARFLDSLRTGGEKPEPMK